MSIAQYALLMLIQSNLCLQAPVCADQKSSLQGADDAILEEAVLPNGAVLQLSLNCGR